LKPVANGVPQVARPPDDASGTIAQRTAAGSAAWLAGNLLWVSGSAIYRVVFWWIAFRVLTIAGERLELNRVLQPSRSARVWFTLAAITTLAGAASTTVAPAIGVRTIGCGLLALTHGSR